MIPRLARKIAEAVKTDPRISALFLSGSHGNGRADEYSDIDFLVVSPDGASDDLTALWHDTLAPLGELIVWRDRSVAPVLMNAVLAPDARIDALFLKPDQIGQHTQDSLVTLFDHDNLFATLNPTRPPTQPNAKHMAYQFEEFIRVLALLPLTIGRQEYINGVTGATLQRTRLIDLLIAETNVPDRGGALSINRLLTADQQNLLINLPPLVPTHDGVIAAHQAYAAAYLPRARAFAQANDIDWPTRFEAVTRTHLLQTLNLTIPDP